MSLFFRSQNARLAARSATSVPDWLRGLDGGGVTTKSGETVSTHRALRMGAMWSSANLLASIVSNLPVDVFQGSGSSKSNVSPQPALVATPSLKVSRREWTYQAMMSLLLRGNAYGIVLARDNLDRPTNVEWVSPDEVTVQEDSSLAPAVYRLGGRIVTDDVIHLRAFVLPGSSVGLSPVEYHAESLGIGLAAQAFGAQWFGDGGHPTAIFQNKTKTIDPAQAAKLKERISAVLRGKREPLVLGADWDYKPIQVSANESQFIEAMGYTDAQVARLYGPGLAEVLGYGSSGSTLTYSNRVDRSLDLLTYSVLPWVNKLEDMLTEHVAAPQTVRFNVSGLLRADPKSQMEIFRIAREIGLQSVDELRAIIDLPPLVDGAGSNPLPIGQSDQDSAARLIQQIYLGVGKVVSVEEAREILREAGVPLGGTVPEELIPQEDAAPPAP